MAVLIQSGERVAFGTDAKPIAGIPEGVKVRLRLRLGSVATAFVREGNSTAKWVLRDHVETWSLGWKVGENVRKAKLL